MNGNTGTVATLKNVAIAIEAIERATQRAAHLPGLVVLYGPSGWGKSTAAAYCMNEMSAVYVACRSTTTRKSLLIAIATELNLTPARTMDEIAEQVAGELARTGRPLIVDEMDHMVDKRAVEIVRDLHDASGAAVLLIGEERLPDKLRQWERVHGRVLAFYPAQPADLEDGRHLRELYCRRIQVADDLLQHIVDAARGSVRRICVNLDLVLERARTLGAMEMSLATWGDTPLYTGEAPKRRVG
ncbi:MAG: ATP-binding protein [Nitrospirota bacterium]|nr:ATP-binding protein [Nitrospirota bacterium]